MDASLLVKLILSSFFYFGLEKVKVVELPSICSWLHLYQVFTLRITFIGWKEAVLAIFIIMPIIISALVALNHCVLPKE